MIQAVLSNAAHPEYGVATIPFPLAQDQYDDCIELLKELEIGDVMERDCRVDEIRSQVPILKRLERVAVNVDELDYLAKRLDICTVCGAQDPSYISSEPELAASGDGGGGPLLRRRQRRQR